MTKKRAQIRAKLEGQYETPESKTDPPFIFIKEVTFSENLDLETPA